MISSLTNKAKNLSKSLQQKTPLEKNLKEATSNDNWGVSNTILHDICKATHDFSDYYIIMQTVWGALAERGAKWRRVFKALTLVEFMIKNGSDRVVDELRDGQFKIRQLQEFHHTEDGKDWGSGIKEKAVAVLALINDPDALRAERENARKNRDKFMGIGNETHNDDFGGKYGGMGSDSYDRYGGRGGGGYDPYSKKNDSPNNSTNRRPSATGGLASRLERGGGSDNPSRLREAKIASYSRRGSREEELRRVARNTASQKKQQPESSSSSDSDSSDKKVTTTPNLLDLNAWSGFDNSAPSATPNDQAFDAFEFGGFTSAAPAKASSHAQSFATAFDSPLQTNSQGFGDFVSAPPQQQQQSGMPDFFAAASDNFVQPQGQPVQRKSWTPDDLLAIRRRSQEQIAAQQQMQRNSLTQQDLQNQMQMQRMSQMQQQPQQQQQPSFLDGISSQLYELNLNESSPNVARQSASNIALAQWSAQRQSQASERGLNPMASPAGMASFSSMGQPEQQQRVSQMPQQGMQAMGVQQARGTMASMQSMGQPQMGHMGQPQMGQMGQPQMGQQMGQMGQMGQLHMNQMNQQQMAAARMSAMGQMGPSPHLQQQQLHQQQLHQQQQQMQQMRASQMSQMVPMGQRGQVSQMGQMGAMGQPQMGQMGQMGGMPQNQMGVATSGANNPFNF